MRFRELSLVSLGLPLAVACQSGGARGADAQADPLIELCAVDPRIRVELSYAREDNFTGERWYPSNRAWLRRSAALCLSRVQERLAARGLGLVVWDAFRPLAVQRGMWEVFPDPNYVADPARGSRHNRGAAVDVALVDWTGAPLAMPTAHDDFSERAARDSTTPSRREREHRELLRAAMEAEGFTGISSEWWHYDAPGWETLPLVERAPWEHGE